MTPDQIRELIEAEFPRIISVRRTNPDGWAFYYREVRRGRQSTRIARATRSGHQARTRFKLAVKSRIYGQEIEVTIDGGEEQVRQLFSEELRLWQQRFQGIKDSMTETWSCVLGQVLGKGRLRDTCHGQWMCKFGLAQLINGSLVARIGLDGRKTGLHIDVAGHNYFEMTGKLSDGRRIVAKNLYVSHIMDPYDAIGSSQVAEASVLRPGFVEITSPGAHLEDSRAVWCDVTNLRPLAAAHIEFTLGSARVRISNLPDAKSRRHRRLMAGLKTAAILGRISVEFPESVTNGETDELLRRLLGLLSLAERSYVSCIARHWKSTEGEIIRSRYEPPHSYSPAIPRPLIPSESLGTFLQDTYAKRNSEAERWDLGLAQDYYLRALSTKSAWPQALGFFTALETLKSAFLSWPQNKDLENYIPKGKFKKKGIVQQVLGTLSSEFDAFKTAVADEFEVSSLKGKIGELNRRAYKVILREMLQQLEVAVTEEELKELVDFRNEIIHSGAPNYHKSPWKNPHEAFRVAARFAALVERVILVGILGYNGNFEPYALSF